MRIAQVSPLVFSVPPADHGGTERVVADLTNALAARGHELSLFAAAGSRADAVLFDQGVAVAEIADGPASLLSAKECIMLDQVARWADRFDIIHCHTEFYHAAVLRHHLHKVIATVHWRADQADRQLCFDHFDGLQVVAISGSQASSMNDRNLAGVVHHGISRDRFSPGKGEGGYCAFLGRMTDQKRPERAIEIARANSLPVRLAGPIDIGNPHYFEKHVEGALCENVHYEGPIDDVRKQHFLGDAAVFLFPIDWPEPFGLVMIEAMSCGTPVVAWRNGSTAEIIEDGLTGFVVDTFQEAVEAVGKARALDRGRIRRRFEQRFTAERMAAQYEAIYERLLGASCERNRVA